MTRPILPRFRSALASLRRDNTGVAAVEFVMVLPLFVLIYLGMFEGSKIYEGATKANTAAETIGDLVSRTRSVSSSELNKIFTVSKAIMYPLDYTKFEVTISGIAIDENGKGTVAWSKKDGGGGLAKDSDYQLPDELKDNPSKFLIIVDTRYTHESPLLHSVIASSLDIDRQFAVVPRLSTDIPCSDC
ncbi:TadE/TadG family type IV pilus assembly protein [Fulvimarina sp. MAC8]|uniref:TadE/TadG family type IV pilus assembly protein n=1 Tax=Fulvimarina sp. MAC8 TaxID=3162874 RepID=UPI0032F0964F